MDERATAHTAPPADLHRRRAAYLYGLIVSGAVLAASPDALNIAHVALALLGTLVIYWAAETYVHFIATRTHLQRRLTRHERVGIVRDGLPPMAAAGTIYVHPPLTTRTAKPRCPTTTRLPEPTALPSTAG